MACWSRAASELLSWQVTLIVDVTGTAPAAVAAGPVAATARAAREAQPAATATQMAPVAATVRAAREYRPAPKPAEIAMMPAGTAIGSQRRRPRFWGRLPVVWSP